VNYLPESALQDPDQIKSILNDRLSAYDLLDGLVKNPERLNKDMICSIHARLMKTCRFNDPVHYVAAGKTRTETRKTVIIRGTVKIECCPFPDVDAVIEYVCRMAKVKISIARVFILVSTLDAFTFLDFDIFVAMDQELAEPFRRSKLASSGPRHLPSFRRWERALGAIACLCLSHTTWISPDLDHVGST